MKPMKDLRRDHFMVESGSGYGRRRSLYGRTDMVGISVFFIALIAGLEIYFAIKYRRRSPGEIPPKTIPSIPLEVAWIAIPFLICMVMSGQKLFRQLHCATCHKTDGTGRCPVLEGIFGKQVQLQDWRSVTVDESYIRESILDPKAKIAAGYDPIMPNFTGLLSEEQVAQLIAYIKSIGGPQQETATQSSGPKGTVTTGSPSARGTP
jgi:cytochrome c2